MSQISRQVSEGCLDGPGILSLSCRVRHIVNSCERVQWPLIQLPEPPRERCARARHPPRRRGRSPGARRSAGLLARAAHADRQGAGRAHRHPAAQHVPLYRAAARHRPADRRRPRRLSPVARLISLARAAEAAERSSSSPTRSCATWSGVRRDGDLRPADRAGPGLRAPGRVGRTTCAPPSSRASRCRWCAARAAGCCWRDCPHASAQELLAPLAQADPEAAARLEESVARVAARGWATSEEEIDRGVWAASAAVTDGQATIAALTVPSPLVRAPAAPQEQLLGQVRAAAARLSEQIENSKRS